MVKVERVAGVIRFRRAPSESDVADVLQLAAGLAVVAMWVGVLWR